MPESNRKSILLLKSSQVGKNGEKRVVITMNGKFLPHIEQIAEDNTVPWLRNRQGTVRIFQSLGGSWQVQGPRD